MTDCAIIGIPGIRTFALAVYKDCTHTYNHFDKMTLITMWVPIMTQSCNVMVFIFHTLSGKKCYNYVDPLHTVSFCHFLDRLVVGNVFYTRIGYGWFRMHFLKVKIITRPYL